MPEYLAYAPRISPDGKSVVVTVSPGAGFQLPDIWRYEFASNALVRVTTDSSSIGGRWAPDGERIVFLRNRDSTRAWSRPLYTAGQPEEILSVGKKIFDIDMSRQGKVLAMRINGGTNGSPDIWLAHLDSLSTPRPFLTEPYNEGAPALSRDGRLLAYVTNRTGRDEVYVRPVAGGGAEVQVSMGGGAEPLWSPASDELFYRVQGGLISARITQQGRLGVASRDTLLRVEFSGIGNIRGYDVFPDGKAFLVQKNRAPGSGGSGVIVRLNWLAAARSAAACLGERCG